MIKLAVKNRKSQHIDKFQFRKESITIGRSQDCDVVLPSPTASRNHAKLTLVKNELSIEDLDSGNGTFINNEKLEPKNKKTLKDNDIIRIDEFEISYEVANDNKVETQNEPAPQLEYDDLEKSLGKFDKTDPDILEIKMVKKILGALDKETEPTLIFISEPVQNKKITIEDEHSYTIGRDPECEVYIESPVMSRKHAMIQNKWGAYTITDLDSKNGTYVNNEKISEEKTLKDGDEIHFGTLKAFFKNPKEFNLEEVKEDIEKSQVEKSNLEAKKKTGKSAESNKIENPEQEQASDAAKMSLGENTEEKSSAKKENRPKIKEKQKSLEEELEGLSDEQPQSQNKQKKNERPNKILSFWTALSTTEKALLGFGVVVIFIIIVVLGILLNS